MRIPSFSQNSADFGSAGALYTSHNVVLTFNGTNNFINNSADNGGAICTLSSNVLNLIGTNNLINNTVFCSGGAIYISSNSIFTFTGTNNFINNSAKFHILFSGDAISGLYYGNIVLIFMEPTISL